MALDLDGVRDQIEEWEVTLAPEEQSARMSAWAQELEPGSPGRAELLYCTGERLQRDRPQDALTHFEAAALDGGETTIDARAGVLHCLLQLGRDTEVDTLLSDLRRASASGDHADNFQANVADVLETTGRTKDAHRWYTIGLRDFDPAADEPDFDEDMCLSGRYRVRRDLELGLDQFDRFFEEDAPEAAAAIRERASDARSGSSG